MIKQYQINDLHDDTKLVRFLNLYGAEKSIGSTAHGEIYCTFHYGLLHDYKILESDAGDAKEGSTSINLGDGVIGSDTTTNNALVSCWSIWDEKNDPWFSFRESAFAKNKNNICVIVSTVGKVRRIYQQTIDISRSLLGNNFSSIVFSCTDGPVIYYPRECGVEHEYWKEITDVKHGLGMRTISNIFHKRDSNEKGQKYSAECEYRYAMVLGNRSFFGSDTNVALSAEDAILRDYPLIFRNGVHYIEKVYLRTEHPKIEATCYFSGIELIKLDKNIVAV